MRENRYYQKGFTLIELLIVMGMLGVVMAAIYSIYVTHMRSAYTEDEVVDVQQNLRIAMDSITRDIRVAGILIPQDTVGFPNPAAAYNNNVPVGFYQNLGGPLQPLDPPDNVASDTITLNMTSAAGVYARITSDVSVAAVTGNIVFPVDATDYFSVEAPPQTVRIFNAGSTIEPVNTLYDVVAIGQNAAACGALTPPCMTLAPESAGGSTLFQEGFMIARINAGAPRPNTVQYSLAACPAGMAGPWCLQRLLNGPAGAPAAETQFITSNMAGLKFSYLLDNGTEMAAPPDLEVIRAVRVTITGQTSSTVQLSDRRVKTRQMTSVVKIRNRYQF